MNAEGRTEGTRDLILAVFRLAVADYWAISYAHDEPVRRRCVSGVRRVDAAAFLMSPWAAHLADLIGLSSAVIWSRSVRELRRSTDLTGSRPRAA